MDALFTVKYRQHFFMNGRFEGSCLNDMEEYSGSFDGKTFWYEGECFPSVTFEDAGFPGEKVYTITYVTEYRPVEVKVGEAVLLN